VNRKFISNTQLLSGVQFNKLRYSIVSLPQGITMSNSVILS